MLFPKFCFPFLSHLIWTLIFWVGKHKVYSLLSEKCQFLSQPTWCSAACTLLGVGIAVSLSLQNMPKKINQGSETPIVEKDEALETTSKTHMMMCLSCWYCCILPNCQQFKARAQWFTNNGLRRPPCYCCCCCWQCPPHTLQCNAAGCCCFVAEGEKNFGHGI